LSVAETGLVTMLINGGGYLMEIEREIMPGSLMPGRLIAAVLVAAEVQRGRTSTFCAWF
jgi:hypothetical protein